VESCTALAEDEEGNISILYWEEPHANAENVVLLEPHRARDVA
jgi:hypothetical protein